MGIKTAHKFHETAKVLLGNGSFASLIKRMKYYLQDILVRALKLMNFIHLKSTTSQIDERKYSFPMISVRVCVFLFNIFTLL